MWQHSFMTQLLTMWQQYGNVDNLRRSCNCDSAKLQSAAEHRNQRWLNAITTDFLTTKLMTIVTEDNGTARFQNKQLNWLDNSKTRSDWFENIDWLAFSPDSFGHSTDFLQSIQALVWQQNLWITIGIFTFTCPTPGQDSWQQTVIQLQVITRWQWWP